MVLYYILSPVTRIRASPYMRSVEVLTVNAENSGNHDLVTVHENV